MRSPREPLFLERETYRRRRLMDAARALPFLAAFLFVIPALWAAGSATSVGKMYLFGVWAVLILLSAVISHRLMPSIDDRGSEKEPGER